MLTRVFCLRRNLCKQFGKVWEIFRQKLGLKDNVFAGVFGSDLATQEFGLTGDTQSRALQGRLQVEKQLESWWHKMLTDQVEGTIGEHTLKANDSRASVKPGNGW